MSADNISANSIDAPSTSLFVSPHVFFLIKSGAVIAWDFKNHQQYELQIDYFERLLNFSINPHQEKKSIDSELLAGNLLVSNAQKIDWEWDILSQIFHFGTSISDRSVEHPELNPELNPENFISNYINLCKENFDLAHEAKNIFYTSFKTVDLPKPDLSKLSTIDFLSTLKQRKTCRSFNRDSANLEDLNILLYTVFGNFHASSIDYEKYGFQKIGMRKTSPSGGGIHPTEAYLIINNVPELAKGIYYYSPTTHQLFLINELDLFQDLNSLFCGQFFAEDLAFGIFLTSRFDKLWKKYQHSRAYRIALMDAGHLSQTFHLTAAALGLNTWLSGAFSDEKINRALKIDNSAEHALLFLGAGFGDKLVLDKLTRKIYHEK